MKAKPVSAEFEDFACAFCDATGTGLIARGKNPSEPSLMRVPPDMWTWRDPFGTGEDYEACAECNALTNEELDARFTERWAKKRGLR